MPRAKRNPQPCACGCGELTAGYWDNKLKRYPLYKAGHHPTHNPPLQRIPDEVLLQDVLHIEEKLGRPIEAADLKEHGKYALRTYETHFGGFFGILEALGRSNCIDWSPSSVSPADGHWLAGLIDGEGCFRVSRITRSTTVYVSLFQINLRDDDISVLEQIRAILSLDREIKINPRCSGRISANPQAVLALFDTEVIYHKIVPFFRAFPLHSRKVNDFEIFALAAAFRHNRRIEKGQTSPRYSDEERDFLRRCYLACGKIKKYQVTLEEVAEEFDLPALLT